MKKLSSFPLVVMATLTTVTLVIAAVSYIGTATAQDTEFTIYDNGLIYDDHTMERLGHIVDSLNLRFKSCEPRDYHSIAQGYATVVILEKDLDNARRAMKNGVDLEIFLQKFPDAKYRREWIMKYRYTDYQDEKVIEYRLLPLRNGDHIGIRLPDRQANDKERGWVFLEEEGGIVAAYLERVHSQPIPRQYAALIQYADCMIDTTAQVYLTNENPWTMPELPQDSKIKEYLEVADDFEGRPQLPEIEWDSPLADSLHNKYMRENQRWDKARLASLDQKMKTDIRYRLLLLEATREAIENKRGNPALEFYVGRYLSPEKALAVMRLRRPVGRCSMDQGPRLHAQRICRLAAETTQWDIFLRAPRYHE